MGDVNLVDLGAYLKFWDYRFYVFSFDVEFKLFEEINLFDLV
ncbi:MAG: hypothetical protein U0L42_07240 [Methanobrevibacter sp.]|nr:hypothetical protein [Methanobrevibacter sp.]MEE0935451.1 hypothetical protein [Methanobrevibacter sp.]